MLGLGSVLCQPSREEQNDYKSLTGAPQNNLLIAGTFDGVAGAPNWPHSAKGNGIPFSTNYTTSSTFRGNYTMSMWYKSGDGTVKQCSVLVEERLAVIIFTFMLTQLACCKL